MTAISRFNWKRIGDERFYIMAWANIYLAELLRRYLVAAGFCILECQTHLVLWSKSRNPLCVSKAFFLRSFARRSHFRGNVKGASILLVKFVVSPKSWKEWKRGASRKSGYIPPLVSNLNSGKKRAGTGYKCGISISQVVIAHSFWVKWLWTLVAFHSF